MKDNNDVWGESEKKKKTEENELPKLRYFYPLLLPMVWKEGLIKASIYGAIYGNSHKKGYSWITNLGLSDQLKLSRTTVITSIKELSEDGYIEDVTPEKYKRVNGKKRYSIIASRLEEITLEYETKKEEDSEYYN